MNKQIAVTAARGALDKQLDRLLDETESLRVGVIDTMVTYTDDIERDVIKRFWAWHAGWEMTVTIRLLPLSERLAALIDEFMDSEANNDIPTDMKRHRVRICTADMQVIAEFGTARKEPTIVVSSLTGTIGSIVVSDARGYWRSLYFVLQEEGADPTADVYLDSLEVEAGQKLLWNW